MKERLDVILVEQGYAPSREKAKAIIMSGNVYVNGQKEDKAGTGFDVSKIMPSSRNPHCSIAFSSFRPPRLTYFMV